MADLFDNPMGLMGFEFVEFASPTPNMLEPVFETMGFTLVARHRSKDVQLYRQGEHQLHRQQRAEEPGVVLRRRARPVGLRHGVPREGRAQGLRPRAGARRAAGGACPTGPMELRLPAIKGIGGAPLYLIDRFEEGRSIYDIDFEWIDGVDRHPKGAGLKLIDHLTHNVYRGRMAYWAAFYEKLFNFREIRYFDIKGEYTGLTSKAMTAPDGKIRIPLNEESSKGSGQIEEFLMQFNGEGIQHIALLSDDLLAHHRQAADGRRAADDGAERRVLRDARRAAARPRPAGGGAADARHPARRLDAKAASRACCCRSSRRRSSGRCSSSSSSARATTASAKATSRRCSSRSSATRCAAACCKRHDERPCSTDRHSTPGWSSRRRGGTMPRAGAIIREFEFADFTQAFAFMTQIALRAEARDHHPEWSNVYNRVTVAWTTHDVDGVSTLDLEMAQFADASFARFEGGAA